MLLSQSKSSKSNNHHQLNNNNQSNNNYQHKRSGNQLLLPINSYTYKNQQQQCKQCRIKFQSLPQLLNHKQKFCTNSGYDNLTGLLMKQTNQNHHKLNYKLFNNNQLSNKTSQTQNKKQQLHNNNKKQLSNSRTQTLNKNQSNKMKNYGQYSLSKLNYQTNQNIISKRSLLLYNDIIAIQKHNNQLQSIRPYQINSKSLSNNNNTNNNHNYQTNYNINNNYNQINKSSYFNQIPHQFNNQKTDSSFSYRLNNQNFKHQKHSNAQYLQSLLLKNYQSQSPPIKSFIKQRSTVKKSQFIQNQYSAQNIVHIKSNPASYQFQQSFKKPSLLNKSNASIANMPIQQKITYAKFKLDQLMQIKQLYLKNGGQSKQFKANIQKMIQFYQKLLNDCQGKNLNQTRLSIVSRPQTPILKLNQLNNIQPKTKSNNFQQNRVVNTGRPNYSHNNQLNLKNPLNISNPQPFTLSPKINQYPPYNHKIDPNAIIAQNYSHMYQMKVMQDMMKMKSQQNRKLIEALIKGSNPNQKNNLQQTKQYNLKQQAQKYRFANQVNTMKISQDRILKLLQQQQLDQMMLISKLPVNLQDEKIESLIKNTQLRFKMEKQVLKQKLQRLTWQQKLQSFEQQRQVKNNDWVGTKNKDVIHTQMNQYLNNFQQQFRPQFQ